MVQSKANDPVARALDKAPEGESPFEVRSIRSLGGRRLPVWRETGKVPLVALYSIGSHQAGDRYGLEPEEAMRAIERREASLDPAAVQAIGGEAEEIQRTIQGPRDPAGAQAVRRIGPDGRDENGNLVTQAVQHPSPDNPGSRYPGGVATSGTSARSEVTAAEGDTLASPAAESQAHGVKGDLSTETAVPFRAPTAAQVADKAAHDAEVAAAATKPKEDGKAADDKGEDKGAGPRHTGRGGRS